jgi:lipopolysaccharide transport system permease protein
MQDRTEIRLDAGSAVAHPLHLARAMVRDLAEARFIAWRLFVRDTSAAYRQTFFGFLWAFVPPIVVAAGMTLATRAQIIRIADTQIPYPAFVMIGMAIWQTFIESVNGPLQAVTESKPILTRINVPREALVLAKLATIGLNFAIKLLLVASVLVWYGIDVTAYTPFALLPVFALVVLGTAIGLVIAPVGALFEDVSRGLGFVMTAWLFLTPVVYPLPQSQALAAKLISWNPVTPLLVTAKELACGLPLTNLSSACLVSVVAISGLLFGWVVFRLSMPFVIERAGS